MQTITFPFSFGQTIRHRTTGVTGAVVALGAYDTGYQNVRIEYVDKAGALQSVWDDVRKFEATPAPAGIEMAA